MLHSEFPEACRFSCDACIEEPFHACQIVQKRALADICVADDNQFIDSSPLFVKLFVDVKDLIILD